MKKNMGSIDRTLRLVLAVVFAILLIMKVVTGTWAIVLGIVAVVFFLTSLVSSCPLYVPFGLSTRKE